jgi:3-hydroxyacyl-[acyl-carrier-protein] dehydratase
MEADLATRQKVLSLIPQRPPFRFIDEIRELNDQTVLGAYHFRGDEYFYTGHFPGYPLTPGVILIETLAQTGVVALGIYLQMRKGQDQITSGRLISFFTHADEVEFYQPVRPDTQVIVRGTKVYYRLGTLQTRTEMFDREGNLLCRGILAGKGVSLDAQ